MADPSITVSVRRNSKHDTVHSKRLVQCILDITEGAWNTYLELDASEQEWVTKIMLTLELMNDGTTPIALEAKLHVSSANAQWSNERPIKFTIHQLAGQKSPAIANMLKNYILRELRKTAAVELSRHLEQVEAIKATVARISSREEPIRRAV